mgnify:FL=1
MSGMGGMHGHGPHGKHEHPPITPRTSSVRDIASSFIRHAGSAKRLIPLSLVLLLLDGLMQAAVPGLMGYIVDELIRDAAGFARDKLWMFGLLLAAGSLVFYFVAYNQHYLVQKISRTVGVNFQVELYNHLQQLSADFYQRTHVGEITSRLT